MKSNRIISGAGIAAILLVLGCRTVREVKSLETSDSTRKEESAISTSRSSKEEIEYLGDFLTGRMQLPFTVPKPFTYQVDGGGTTLEFTISDSTVSYRTEAKPVARSTLSYSDSSGTEVKLEESAVSVSKSETKTKRTGFPWWIWLIGVIVLASIILIRYFKIQIPIWQFFQKKH